MIKLNSLSISSKWFLFFCTCWIISLVVFHFGFSYQEKLVQSMPYEIGLYSDKSEGGLSEIELITEGDTIGYWFELREFEDSLSWTWAGMSVRLDTSIDISDYDYIELYIKSNKTNNQVFEIAVNYPDGTSLPFHSLSQNAEVDTSYKMMKLPLSGFKTSSWWLAEKDIKDVMSDEVNYKEFLSFTIGEGKYTKVFEREYIFIHSLKVTKYIAWPYFWFGGIFLLVTLFMFIYKFLFEKEREVIIEYEETPVFLEVEEPSVVDYLKLNYQDKELSLEEVSKALGLSESKVSQQIKRETSQTFKQLRNTIRIEEAKSLLMKSDNSIAEISEEVGYENVTSFNRVFKKITNESPSSFRSINKEG